MATCNLTRTWINLLSTGQGVSAASARGGRDEVYTLPGTTKVYAGGRTRSITAAGELGTYATTLLLVDRPTVDLLHTWANQTVQLRDNRGRKIFGIFQVVTVQEIVGQVTRWQMPIVINMVTVTEGV